MLKKKKDRRFFISADDLPLQIEGKEKDEKREVFEIARKCLSGEIKNVEDIIGKKLKIDPSNQTIDNNILKVKAPNCFSNLQILSNFIEKGEVHYDFNAACAKMVYNIQELVKAYNRLQEKNIYEPNLMAEIMREI